MKVELFIPCVVDQFYPEVGWDMVKLLEKLGVELSYNASQTCCGMSAYLKGHREMAKEVATKFLKDFNTESYIVSPSASCVAMVHKFYDGFFKNTSNHNIYRKLQGNIMELSTFLVDVLKVESLPSVFKGRAYYAHSCHALHDLNIAKQPLQLLKMVSGLELIPTEQSISCCGAVGEFSIAYEKLAVELAIKHFQPALNEKVDYVISNEQLCLMHTQGVSSKAGHPLKHLHLATVLASGLE